VPGGAGYYLSVPVSVCGFRLAAVAIEKQNHDFGFPGIASGSKGNCTGHLSIACGSQNNESGLPVNAAGS